MMRRILSAIFLVVSFVMAAYTLLDAGYIRFNYPSRSDFPLQGIDVSHHQGSIDWPVVAKGGVAFAFIKATEGGDFTDPKFTKNWDEAGRVGILRGAYHFLTFCRPVADQLQHIIATIPVETGTFPPVLDLEFGGNCKRMPAVGEMTRDLNFLVTGIETHYGKRPIFYMTQEFAAAFDAPNFPLVPVWIRDIFWRPTLASGRAWTFWQFANRGRLEGISGPVDLNVFQGQTSDLRALLL